MKKFISILAAAVCAATCTSFIACGSEDETEPETPSDVVTEEEWVAAFDYENFENVTVDRSYSYYYDYSSSEESPFAHSYYDPDAYYKYTEKQSVVSTTKLDLDYSLAEYDTDRMGNVYYLETYNGYAYNESSMSYEYTWDFNYTDVDVLKNALEEAYPDDDWYANYDWESYKEYYSDSKGTENNNNTYIDYFEYEIDDEYAYIYNSYIAELAAEDGATGGWEYYNYDNYYNPISGMDAMYYALGNEYSLDNYYYGRYYASSEWYHFADLYDIFTYDEESGAYVYTYESEGGYIDYDSLMAIEVAGYEYTLDGNDVRTYYIKINDGHISSVKIELSGFNDFGVTYSDGEYYYENTKYTTVSEYKFHDYGTTTVEVPDDISSALAALK